MVQVMREIQKELLLQGWIHENQFHNHQSSQFHQPQVLEDANILCSFFMKTTILILSSVLFLTSCGSVSEKTEVSTPKSTTTSIGTPIPSMPSQNPESQNSPNSLT